jgi:hypothetical protein
VWASTGFAGPDRSPLPEVPERHRRDLERVQAFYEEMRGAAVGAAA